MLSTNSTSCTYLSQLLVRHTPARRLTTARGSSLQFTTSMDSFKKQLKTYLFSQALFKYLCFYSVYMLLTVFNFLFYCDYS